MAQDGARCSRYDPRPRCSHAGGAVRPREHDYLARQAFVEGDTAYFVGSASELDALQPLANGGSLDIALLPAGPDGDASPILETYGIMLNASATEGQAVLASDLVRFLTNQESAQRLALSANVVPANATADLSDYPILSVFADQAQTAAVLPNVPELESLLAAIEEAYVAVSATSW